MLDVNPIGNSECCLQQSRDSTSGDSGRQSLVGSAQFINQSVATRRQRYNSLADIKFGVMSHQECETDLQFVRARAVFLSELVAGTVHTALM